MKWSTYKSKQAHRLLAWQLEHALQSSTSWDFIDFNAYRRGSVSFCDVAFNQSIASRHVKRKEQVQLYTNKRHMVVNENKRSVSCIDD